MISTRDGLRNNASLASIARKESNTDVPRATTVPIRVWPMLLAMGNVTLDSYAMKHRHHLANTLVAPTRQYIVPRVAICPR